jgi:hypothetical protein
VKRSEGTGKQNTFYYPSPKAMNSVKQKIREIVRTGQHWNLPELVKEKTNPPRLGQLLQDGKLKKAIPNRRQLHDVCAHDYAAEETQEAVQRMEGSSAVVVL